MRRAFIIFFIPLLLTGGTAFAQDTNPVAGNPDNTAAAIAAKQAAEERFQRMASDMQALQSDNEALHAKISSLEQEIQTLRDAQAHAGDNSGVQDELKRLAQSIQEVDKKRIEDKDAISEDIRNSIERLEKLIGTASVPPPAIHEHEHGDKPKPTADDSGSSSPAPPVDGYSYTIKSGDTLGAIVKAYNEDYKSKGLKTITIRQAKEANPKVDWNRLRVGQKIIIPRPEGG